METISVFLTAAQKNKLNSGKTFQLSAAQIQSGTGKHNVDIELTSKDYKKLVQNVRQNKGFRFTADKIVGNGIFKDIAKSVGKTVAKKIAPILLDKIGERTGQTGITNALKKSTDDLIDVGAERISGGRMKKGSPEMKAHMARLRSMKGKGVVDGGDIASDFRNFGRKVKRGFTKTFTPKLGREIKDAFTSKPAREIYKGIANVGLKLGSDFTGLPLDIAGDEINRQIDGAAIKKKGKTNNKILVKYGTLVAGVPQPIKGKGMTGLSGTKYGEGIHGGSFKSESRGGSFLSAQ